MHIHNVIFSKTVAKLVTILANIFFANLNSTSYLNSSGNYQNINKGENYQTIQSREN